MSDLILPPNIDRDAQLLDLDRVDSQESLYHFFRGAWHAIDAAPWVDGWCMEAIAEHLEAVCDGQIKRLLINISPRCSKSNLVSVAFPTWVWAQPEVGPISGPGVPFLHASYANQLSLRDSVKRRRLIESTWYQHRFGHRFRLTSDQNTKSRFTNDKGGECLITSVDGTNTGEGGMCFVAGTMVSTPHGPVEIEKLNPGDTVFAFDGARKVSSTIQFIATRESESLWYLRTLAGREFICTGSHRIYKVTEDRYVRADSLSFGDALLTEKLTQDPIVEIHEQFSDPELVYDIQVEINRNFFADGILVHNCVIIDDPNSVDDVDSEANIQRTIDWWTGTMPTRLNNQETGAYIIIQQRTFESDLTGHILETEVGDWVHLMIPMRYEPERSFHTIIGWKDPRTESGQLMWPERFSESATKRLETRLGPFRSAGQLQQRPEPAGGGIIKRDWWKLWDRESYPPMDFVLACLDTAYTEDTMNDPSGMIIWGIFSGDVKAQTTRIVGPDGEMLRPDPTYSEFAPNVMCMYGWDAHLELHELVKKVAETCIRMKVDLLVIENKASGISVAQEIRRLYSRERFGVKLFDPKSQDKTARLYSVQHLFAEGVIYAPDRPWAERIMTQVGQFPKGKNDEFVDLTSMGLRELRDMGLLVRQPEREAELEAQKIYPRGQNEPLYPA
jgi:predicted phage terminase large subunit-like protein